MHLHINSCNLILFSVDVHCFLVMTSTWPICFFFALRPYDSVYLWATRWPLQAAFGWGAKRLGKPPRDLQLTGGLQDFYIFNPSYFFWQIFGRPSKKTELLEEMIQFDEHIFGRWFNHHLARFLSKHISVFMLLGRRCWLMILYISLLIDHQNQLSKIDP